MQLKTLLPRMSALTALFIAIINSGCQSVPLTANKSDVMRDILSREQALLNRSLTQLDKLTHKYTLAENDAVLIALQQNAAFAVLLTDLEIAKADLTQAGLLPNPELLFAFGVTNKPYRYAIDLPIELLWTRPIKMRAMKLAADTVALKLTQSGLNLIRDVRVSYAQTVLSQEYLEVAQSAYQLRNQIFDISVKRLNAGDISQKEMLLAKNDAAAAKRDWEIAQFDVRLKKQSLLNLLGVDKSPEDIQLQPTVVPACTVEEVDHLLTQSIAQRPDIMAARLTVNQLQEKLSLAKLDWIKLISTADATSGQRNGHTLGPAMRATVPIANQNQGVISKAEAELLKSQRTLDALLQQASLEIKNTHLQYQQSCRDWSLLKTELIPNTHQMRQLTEEAYQIGDISYLQTLEANRQILETQLREIQLKSDLISKLAELKRSSAYKQNSASAD